MSRSLSTLARIAGAQERTLRRAVADGTVRVVRPSPRRVVVAAEEVDYLRQTWPLLALLRKLLRTEPNVDLAILFGSVARGDARQESDLDLLIAFKEPHPLAASRLRARLQPHFDRALQVTDLTDAARSSALLLDVLEDGRVLVDRGERWEALLVKRPSISSEASRQRREVAAAAARALEYFHERSDEGPS